MGDSDLLLGVVIIQQFKPIAFYSRKINTPQKRYYLCPGILTTYIFTPCSINAHVPNYIYI